jgi:hypothetical protein
MKEGNQLPLSPAMLQRIKKEQDADHPHISSQAWNIGMFQRTY